MAFNLNLTRGPNRIFSSFHSDEEAQAESLLPVWPSEVTGQRLRELCEKTHAAMEEARGAQVGQDKVNLLLAAGREVYGALAEETRHALRTCLAGAVGQAGLQIRLDLRAGLGAEQQAEAELARLRELVAVPWEVMVLPGDRLLGEVCEIGRRITLPVGTAYREQRGPSAQAVMLIVCDPDLPEAKREGLILQQQLKQFGARLEVRVRIGISKRELLSVIPGVDILHFAGHAERDPGRAGQMGWRLNPDERLDAEAIAGSGILHWPTVLFANACVTEPLVPVGGPEGSPAGPGSRSADGLAFAVLRHGVRHYIGTFARLPDCPETVDFACAFYRGLLARQTVGASLRGARHEVGPPARPRGRLISASYLHYGNPAGTVFGEPEPADAAQEKAGEVARGQKSLCLAMLAQLQGRFDQSLDILDRLRRAATDEEVVKQLTRIHEGVLTDRAQRNSVRQQIKVGGVAAVSRQGRIGPYEVVEEIGHGPYRTVFRARCFREDLNVEEVALALPHNQYDDAVRRQRRAFRGLRQKLRGPGLVPIYETADSGELFYVVYELVRDGRALRSGPDAPVEPWPLDEVGRLIEQVGSALDTAHEQGLVHGELTPRDILRSGRENYRVLDVGRYEALCRCGERRGFAEAGAPYRAPEQWTDHGPRTDAAADQWAFSVIAYEMLTGRHPFASAVENGDWGQAVRSALPTPAHLARGEVPPQVGQVLWRGMARRPQDRYGSVGEMVRAFRRALRGTARLGGFVPDLEASLEAGAALVYVRSDDESSSLAQLQAIAGRLDRQFFTWRLNWGITRGIKVPARPGPHASDLPGALRWLGEHDQPAILALVDAEAFLDAGPLAAEQDFPVMFHASSQNPPVGREPPAREVTPWNTYDSVSWGGLLSPVLDRPLGQWPVYPKEAVHRLLHEQGRRVKESSGPPRTYVVVADAVTIPQELSKEFQVFHRLPPRAEDVQELIREVREELGDAGGELAPVGIHQYAWNAAGMTRGEIRDSLRRSVVLRGALVEACLEDLRHDKEQIVRRGGLLELWHPRVKLDDVVGLDVLKAWLSTYRGAAEGLFPLGAAPPPKGVLLGGLPGCGKSLCAQAIAGSWGWPLLRLDVGRVFGGRLGESEQNMRAALALAEQMSPVVMWVDEIEKAFGQFPGAVAGATSMRVLQTFLCWLQERGGCVFLAATANDGDAIPPELARAGRFDAVFFLDLPNRAERRGLLEHGLRAHGRGTAGHDWDWLAARTEGYTSAELAGRIVNALFLAADEGRVDPAPAHLRRALLAEPSPMIKRPDQRERFQRMRRLWRSFAMPASSPDGGVAGPMGPYRPAKE